MPRLARNFGVLLSGFAWALGACAGPPSAGATESAYRSMREQEAALERADAQRRAAPCAARPELARSVCDAAREICELAQTLAETDAKERCGQARARCAELDGGAPCGKSSQ